MIEAAIEGSDVAVIIGVLSGALAALAAFTLTIFRIAQTMAGDLRSINRAVNHQDPNAPTLIERVKGIEAGQAAHNAAALLVSERVQRIEESHASLAEARNGVVAALGDVVIRLARIEARQQDQENM